MLYFFEVGGKWLCFFIVLVVLNVYGKSEKDGILVGCVVEMIYMYLLIYDDFFCMDDDDLCCGKLINYKVFGEVIVVLVGDGFLMESFKLIIFYVLDEVLVEKCFWFVNELILVVGIEGMVGG